MCKNMSTIIHFSCRRLASHCNLVKYCKTVQKRTFLSNAYYCQEVWDSRLKSPLLQNINLDEFYHEMDIGYQKNKNISAVDVDIFANAVKDDAHIDELLDVVHKLRLSSETSNMLESTTHSVIRNLMNNNHYEKLLQVLDDRLNYGIFLDSYTANILLDTFWKNKDYISGARIASQIMLQEDFSNSLTMYLSLLHCYKFLQKPEDWHVPPKLEEEPEEEIKVRVKYIRNPYFDDHFDLINPLHIIGKTFWMAGLVTSDVLGRTFQLVGLTLYDKNDEAKLLLEKYLSNNETIIKEALHLLPEDNEIRQAAENLKCEENDIQKLLEEKIHLAERNNTEKDIAEQCTKYDEWDCNRQEALNRQQKRYEIAQRLVAIEESQKKLKEKELQLWFFDREEQLELDIDAKKVFYPKRWFGKKKKPKQVDAGYVPPDVKTAYNKEK